MSDNKIAPSIISRKFQFSCMAGVYSDLAFERGNIPSNEPLYGLFDHYLAPVPSVWWCVDLYGKKVDGFHSQHTRLMTSFEAPDNIRVFLKQLKEHPTRYPSISDFELANLVRRS